MYWLKKLNLFLGRVLISHHKIQRRNLRDAIDEALEKHEMNNGKRYFVVDDFWNPDHFLVCDHDQLKYWQRSGRLRKTAHFKDFMKYARFVTPAKNISAEGKNHLKKQLPFSIWIAMIVIGFILLAAILKAVHIDEIINQLNIRY